MILFFKSFQVFMERSMFSTISEQLQVFRSIILFIFNRTKRIFNAFMMHTFFRFKIATNIFFHYKTRTPNIILGSSKRMIVLFKPSIAIFVPKFSTFPSRIIFFDIIRYSFFEMRSSSIGLWVSFLKNHNFLHIKKAAFGGLKKTVMFSHLLTAKFSDIKNPFSLSNTIISLGG